MSKLKSSQKKRVHSDLSQNGFPKPKKAKCFQCAKELYIKFVLPRQEYSQKNSWTYDNGWFIINSIWPLFIKKKKKKD